MFEKKTIKKDKRINLRLKSEDYDRLNELSRQSGRTKTDIILDGINDEIRKFINKIPD